MLLLAKTTGWTEEAILMLPEQAFDSYLADALRAHGVDPDAPPAPGEVHGLPQPAPGAELPLVVRQALGLA